MPCALKSSCWAAVALVAFGVASAAPAATTIGNFAGGVAETGWGRFNPASGVGPLDSSVYTVTDLDTSGDGGALETNIPGFSDSFGYSFSNAGTEADFFANDLLVFDLIYRGEATNDAVGGYSQVYQVLFQSNFNGNAFTAYQQNADGVPLNSFSEGGTSAGFGPGDAASPAYRMNVAIDYRSFRDGLPDGFDPSFLQFWMSTNDDNRIFKAIDNVRLTTIPEPASLSLLGTLAAGALLRRRAV